MPKYSCDSNNNLSDLSAHYTALLDKKVVLDFVVKGTHPRQPLI